jgi:hypothetical protein
VPAVQALHSRDWGVWGWGVCAYSA